MALWLRLSNHRNFENIKSRYNEQFPIEVRSACAEWIEYQILSEQNVDVNIGQSPENFISSLIGQLESENEKYDNPENIPIFYHIENSIRMFRANMYNSFAIYKQIRDTITYEQHFLDINEKLDHLKLAVSENTEIQNKFNNELNSFNSLVFNETMTTLEARKSYHMKITQIAGYLLKSFQFIITEIQNVLNMVIFERLGRWQRDQAFIANGAQLPDALDEIQDWFAEMAQLICTTRNSINATRNLNAITAIQINNIRMNEQMDHFHSLIMQQLQQLIVSGFIVEKQPPQVIKTKTRFAATVRLLDVGFQLNDPLVTVSILSGKNFF